MAGGLFCGTTAPAGFMPLRADQLVDCFDRSDAVHPGVTTFFSSPAPGWGWDFNCSGTAESTPQNVVACGTAGGTCTPIFGNCGSNFCGTSAPVSACGDPTGHGRCGLFQTSGRQLVSCH